MPDFIVRLDDGHGGFGRWAFVEVSDIADAIERSTRLSRHRLSPELPNQTAQTHQWAAL